MAEQLIFPGDVTINDVKLTNAFGDQYDIKSIIASFEIIEDIFQPSLQAIVTLDDGVGLLSRLPFVGEETIEVTWTVPDKDPQNRKFTVYSIDNVKRRDSTLNTLVYILRLVDRDHYNDKQVSISRGWKQSKISEIVSNVIKSADMLNSQNTVDVEDTDNPVDIVVPNYSPYAAIELCRERAKSAQYEGSRYLFYQAIDGYHFVTLDSLLSKSPVADLNLFVQHLGTQTSEKELDTIDGSWEINEKFDVVEQIENGMYSSNMIAHDLVTKSVIKTDYKLGENFDKIPHCDDQKTNSDDFITNVQSKSNRHYFIPTNSLRKDITYGNPEKNNSQIEQFIQLRDSGFAQLNSQRASFTIPGNQDIKPGSKIFVEFPTFVVNDENNIQQYLTGNYFVSVVRHVITLDKYWMTLECNRDSFDLPVSSKVNIS